MHEFTQKFAVNMGLIVAVFVTALSIAFVYTGINQEKSVLLNTDYTIELLDPTGKTHKTWHYSTIYKIDTIYNSHGSYIENPTSTKPLKIDGEIPRAPIGWYLKVNKDQ